MKPKSLFFLFFYPWLSFAQTNSSNNLDSIQVTKIYDTKEYSAFTDLLRFNNAFYCSFRVGAKHAGYEDYGKVRIIKSLDGNNWESIAELNIKNLDLRDPKLSVTPDGRIMVIMAGARFNSDNLVNDLYPMVSFSNQRGEDFEDPTKVVLDPNINPSKDWLWRVTWNNNVGYGINYQLKENSRDWSKLDKDAWLLYLLKSNDGKSFESVSQLDIDHLPNESTIRFDKNGTMYVLVRRESAGKLGVLAKSSYPYTNWSYTNLDFRLGGPNFLFLNDNNLVIGTRNYIKKASTSLLVTNLDGKVLKKIELPSGGDTSYPGMLVHDEKLWVSYYSNHEGNSSIYLAQVPLNKLK
ncbi:hypothetical protein [Arenibacter latericius]|uniref:hypothetical protein n=1 Tax=Arenibacter latericius TaxID=86104 RepID=UPI00041983A2|nr:hypothetical protein [Arenibacter latericius]